MISIPRTLRRRLHTPPRRTNTIRKDHDALMSPLLDRGTIDLNWTWHFLPWANIHNQNRKAMEYWKAYSNFASHSICHILFIDSSTSFFALFVLLTEICQSILSISGSFLTKFRPECISNKRYIFWGGGRGGAILASTLCLNIKTLTCKENERYSLVAFYKYIKSTLISF